MRTVISQSVVLPAPAEGLFAMYTDPAKHAAITGAPVAISVEPGSPFQAFNAALTGATLQIIPQRLVIQSWRSTKFNDGDPDSTLILAFTPEGTNGRIDDNRCGGSHQTLRWREMDSNFRFRASGDTPHRPRGEAASHRSRLPLRRDPPSGRDLDDGTVSQLLEELAGEMNRPSDRKRRISGYGDRTWTRKADE